MLPRVPSRPDGRAVTDASSRGAPPERPAPDNVVDDPGIAGGAALNAGGQVAAAVAGALTGIAVARLLGPSGTGSFNVLLAALLLGYAVCTLGVSTGLTYRVSSGAVSAGAAFRHALVGASVLGLAGIAIALAVASIGDSGPLQRIPLGTVALGMAALPFFLGWMAMSSLAIAVQRYAVAAAAPAGPAGAPLAGGLVLTPPLRLTGGGAAATRSHAPLVGAGAGGALGRPPPRTRW